MIGQAVPLFESGNLLTKEMLNAIKEYAFDFGELLFQGYSDGILCGCQVTTTKSLIQLNPGIILYRGKVYLINQPLAERYYPTERETFFKIRMKDEVKTQNFVYLELETVVESEAPERSNELEVCRFKLQEGFKLRTEYQSFEDRVTPYDTVNIVHSPFASFSGRTLSPVIIKDFANRMVLSKSENALDQMFCMQAYQAGGKAMDAQALVSYLAARLDIEFKEYSNIELFGYLEEVLKECNNKSHYSRQSQRVGHRIMLD